MKKKYSPSNKAWDYYIKKQKPYKKTTMLKNVKKDFGLKEIRVEAGSFDFGVLFVIGKFEKLEEYCRWKFDDKDYQVGGISRGMHCWKEGYVSVIWMPHKPKTAREYSTLAHECLHATCRAMRWAGVPFTRDTEEVMTHTMAHLFANSLAQM